ncbi:MAG: chemotaxis protein CheW [Pseudomonadota bacterium]
MSTAETMRQDAVASGRAAMAMGQRETLLIFRLAGEAFGVPVSEVDEIVDPIARTPVPNASFLAPALVNVRGAIAPLVDIRARLNLPPAPADASMRMIVLQVQVEGAPLRLAIEAEAVEEVFDTDISTLLALPELGANWPSEIVRGVAQRANGLVILLDSAALVDPCHGCAAPREASSTAGEAGPAAEGSAP